MLSISSIDLESMVDRLSVLSQKDAVISENIANADTPGYHSKMLQVDTGSALALDVTCDGHIKDTASDYYVVEAAPDTIKPNGNTVDANQQLLRKSENLQEINMVGAVYNKIREMENLVIAAGKD